MTRIAILGGGIAGLTVAYELEKARKRGADLDWHLYESTNRLGGIVETTREQGFILEGGPDGWVSEKPWARDLAIELGLEQDLIASNDATRKTYILINSVLQPIPDRMRMMVPEDLTTLESSPLFSAEARKAYAAELTRADELKSQTPDHDESVASFVQRHFGEEVLTKIAAPLLSGVFGGDVHKLSVRAVMPNFVTMEREHGSLIAALQSKAAARGNRPQQPIFTTLRNGLGTLIEALIATLPPDRIHLSRSALSLKCERNQWCLRTSTPSTKGHTGKSKKHFHHVLLATPIDATRHLLAPIDPTTATLIPTNASSAVLAAFAWPAEAAATFTVPPGFGLLVPQANDEKDYHPERSEGPAFRSQPHDFNPHLLAATFVDQKFPDRAPANARILRAFFGGISADVLSPQPDAAIANAALNQLRKILGPMPTPAITTVRRWPRSLPQYEVGHIDRIAELDLRIAELGNLTLLGNGYRGVGLPDLIRDSRAAAKSLTKLPAQ
jgi:oxygen-dependent protoporphyrinogen oxidase